MPQHKSEELGNADLSIEHTFSAIEGVLMSGQQPTPLNVRDHLGGRGTDALLSRHIARWYETYAADFGNSTRTLRLKLQRTLKLKLQLKTADELGLTTIERGLLGNHIDRQIAGVSTVSDEDLGSLIAALEEEAAELEQKALASVEIDGGNASEYDQESKDVRAFALRYRQVLTAGF